MPSLNSSAPAAATVADVLRGCAADDRVGNIERLTDAGWPAFDAQREATVFAKLLTFAPQPLTVDFDAIPEPPDWIVQGWIERGTVVMFSGDTGAAKSIVASSLVASALTDGEWLGRRANVQRVVVVDEENPARLVRSRLRALGVTNDVRDRLRYFSREGIALADGAAWDAWVAAELDDFQPDLLIIDTLMSATAVEDTNSNAEAVRVMKNLRALAVEHGCAVLLMHHERKRSLMNPASSGQAMMGARQWAGQADGQMTITVVSDLIEDAADDGGRSLRRTFKLLPAEKDRDGNPNVPRLLAVESEKDAAGRLLWMRVADEGAMTEETAQDTTGAAILAALRDAGGDGTMTTAELAKAAGEKSPSDPSGTFRRALGALLDSEKIEKPKRGRYIVTATGRADSSALPL